VILALGACGPAQVVVSVENERQTEEGATEMVALGDLEIQVIPFNRDAVFDSMTNAFPTADPGIPDSVLAAQEEIQAAQAQWQAAEQTWQDGRDRLQQINSELETLNRGEARYRVLFQEFGDVESEVARAERAMNAAFDRFTELQNAAIQATEAACIVQANWGDEAFAGVGDIFRAKETASGMRIAFDTTDASGIANLELKPGTWWVHSRYPLPFEELYWNVQVEVVKGDPVQVRLNPANAERRLNIC
jgi:hypothetical protein